MWVRGLLIISNVLILGLFGWLLYANRRPLCIDSRVVEKIDISTRSGGESAWSCNYRKTVPFSPYLHEMIPQIQDKLRRADNVFKAVGALKKPARLQISLQHPWIFEVMGHHILIGEQLFLSEGHLEKALFKVWYRERASVPFAYSMLAEEAVTDLMVFMAQDELNIEDRFYGLKTRLAGARWPQVLKSIPAYCESPWKMSEHFHVCVEGKSLEKHLSEVIMPATLRPLVSSSLIDSYQKLKFKEKYKLLGNFSDFVTSKRNPPLNVMTALWESNPSTLLVGREILKEIKEFLLRAETVRTHPSYKTLTTHFTHSLNRRGFQESTSEVHFDYIYESFKPLEKNSQLFKDLQKISEDQPDRQIAFSDGQHIWFLPSRTGLKVSLFSGIKARSRIVETCGTFDFDFVRRYFDKAEKLLVIDSCHAKEPHKLRSYFAEGPKGFARENPGISFVQFHLPSLQLKMDQIPPKENVLALIQKRDINNPIMQTLGWQEIYWENQIQAYKPKAQVEAIQLFRF